MPGLGFDCFEKYVPHKDSVVYPPGAPAADLDRVYIIGVRLVFDWRRYF